jgi:excisionase family DNA binding protein
MAKPPPPKPYEQVSETTRQLEAELRRRGLSDDEIVAATRKKKRRKPLEFAVVKQRHLMEPQPAPIRGYAAAYKGRFAPGPDLVTVEHAAARLMLHPKTVLRFIHEGRLPAQRIGKAYRIARADLDAFAGVPTAAELAPEPPWATAVVDAPAGDAAAEKRLRDRLSQALAGRLSGAAPLRGEIIAEPERGQLRVVIVGEAAAAAGLLAQVAGWLAEPPPQRA